MLSHRKSLALQMWLELGLTSGAMVMVSGSSCCPLSSADLQLPGVLDILTKGLNKRPKKMFSETFSLEFVGSQSPIECA